jgi:hypothetical protein
MLYCYTIILATILLIGVNVTVQVAITELLFASRSLHFGTITTFSGLCGKLCEPRVDKVFSMSCKDFHCKECVN